MITVRGKLGSSRATMAEAAAAGRTLTLPVASLNFEDGEGPTKSGEGDERVQRREASRTAKGQRSGPALRPQRRSSTSLTKEFMMDMALNEIPQTMRTELEDPVDHLADGSEDDEGRRRSSSWTTEVQRRAAAKGQRRGGPTRIEDHLGIEEHLEDVVEI